MLDLPSLFVGPQGFPLDQPRPEPPYFGSVLQYCGRRSVLDSCSSSTGSLLSRQGQGSDEGLGRSYASLSRNRRSLDHQPTQTPFRSATPLPVGRGSPGGQPRLRRTPLGTCRPHFRNSRTGHSSRTLLSLLPCGQRHRRRHVGSPSLGTRPPLALVLRSTSWLRSYLHGRPLPNRRSRLHPAFHALHLGDCPDRQFHMEKSWQKMVSETVCPTPFFAPFQISHVRPAIPHHPVL